MNPDKRTAFRESFKTALALVIAYGISLAMGWDKPMWAGFAVAFCSLATIGQSVNKAAMRMLGTFVGAAVAIAIIALTSQERWLFITLLSAWIGLCTYLMAGPKYQYFWHVCGFVCAIICVGGGPNSTDAFNLAMLRTQETGAGVLVYSLVSIFLWPVDSKTPFETAARALASTQAELFRACRGLMQGEDKAADAQSLSGKTAQAQGGFEKLLGAAETDSYEVSEVRGLWQGYRSGGSAATETMERLRESMAEWRSLDLPRLLPNLAAAGAELEFRFAAIEEMLAGRASERQPKTVDLAFDEAAVRGLSHLQKAALAATRARLEDLEKGTRRMFADVSAIAGSEAATVEACTAQATRAGFVPDLDRLIGVARVVLVLWLAFLAWIYVDAIPGGSGLISMATPIGMALAATPQIGVMKMLKPALAGVFLAAPIYLLVMPRLSGYGELALLLFGVIFAYGYLFSAPQKALGKIFGLAMFMAITGVTNEQQYSFLAVVTTALMLPTVFTLIAVSAHVPVSMVPEKAFLRLLSRFFRSCESMVAAMAAGPPHGWWEGRRRAFHAREVATLPGKLAAWGKFVDPAAVPGVTPQQVQALVGGLQGLSRCARELEEENGREHAPFLVKELGEAVGERRLAVERAFGKLAADPGAIRGAEAGQRLAEAGRRLEDRIGASFEKVPEGELGEQDGENFYRLLGAYRGMSEAIVDFAGKAGVIDWARWREERFA